MDCSQAYSFHLKKSVLDQLLPLVRRVFVITAVIFFPFFSLMDRLFTP
jgi:hypothetical protein